MLKNLLIAAALMTSMAVSSGVSLAAGIEVTPTENAVDADFAVGKKAIDAKDWNAAIAAFSKVVARNPANADAHNFLGYAYRWTGKMDESFSHYNSALRLEPNHKGAHEYIGVAYLKVDKPDQARVHLGKLEKICGRKCEEYVDLAKAIADYKSQPPKKAKGY